MNKVGRPPVNELVTQRILEDYKAGVKQKDIADRYGIHRVTVSKLLRKCGVPARAPKSKKKSKRKPKPFTLHVKIPRELKDKLKNCKHSDRKLITALLKHYFTKVNPE